MVEQWRFIPGFPKTYLVSDRGRVFSVRARRVLEQHNRNNIITLQIDRKPAYFSIRNLVKSTFGLACNKCECEKAEECWRCGFNQAVDEERKRHIRERGLTVSKKTGLQYFRILPKDYEGYIEYNGGEEIK